MAINNNNRWGVRMNPPDVLKAKMGARREAARFTNLILNG
jgi:hypothetical protein